MGGFRFAYLKRQQVRAKILDEPLAIVSVGMIELGAFCENSRIDRLISRVGRSDLGRVIMRMIFGNTIDSVRRLKWRRARPVDLRLRLRRHAFVGHRGHAGLDLRG